jgi:hypothetical protein
MRMRFVAPLLVAAAVASGPVAAQLRPVFHGVLSVKGGGGRLDQTAGIGSLTVKNWVFTLSLDSDGIAPATESIVIGIGENDQLVIPAGQVKASRNGKRFTYRNRGIPRGVRSFAMKRLEKAPDGTMRYAVTLSVVGADLSKLVTSSPTCVPLAVIVGDDDGFSGVDIERPRILTGGSRLRVLGACTDVGDWPWL